MPAWPIQHAFVSADQIGLRWALGRLALGMQSVPVEVGTEMLDVEVHVTYALR